MIGAEKKGHIVVVRMDCPVCGCEAEIICRVTGKASRHQYADSREVTTVSVQCEAGCDFTSQQVAELREEAEAIAADECWEEEKGW